MDVFVIPVGQDQYELHFEASSDVNALAAVPASGILGKLRHRFNAVLRAADEQHPGSDGNAATAGSPPQRGLVATLQRLILKVVARRVTEQRLLWALRRQTAAVVVHPQDMTFEQVLALIHRMLQRDLERHRLRFAVHLMGLVVSSVLAPFPGPNILAYYFAFRVVGHWLSMRGAKQGLQRVSWSGRPCPALTDLREVAILEPRARDARILDVAARLRLPHLSSLFARATAQPVIDSSQQS